MGPAWVFVWLFVYKPNNQTNTLLPARSEVWLCTWHEEGGPRLSASLRHGDPLPRPNTSEMFRARSGTERWGGGSELPSHGPFCLVSPMTRLLLPVMRAEAIGTDDEGEFIESPGWPLMWR